MIERAVRALELLVVNTPSRAHLVAFDSPFGGQQFDHAASCRKCAPIISEAVSILLGRDKPKGGRHT